jgi:hypothetical protein
MTRLYLFMALLSLGCTGSLVTAQHDALRAKYGSTPGDVGYAPSERCQSLDRQRTDWAAVEQTAIVLTGASGVSTIPVERLPDRYQDGAYIGIASTAVVSAAVATYAGVKAHAAAEAWVREGCSP